MGQGLKPARVTGDVSGQLIDHPDVKLLILRVDWRSQRKLHATISGLSFAGPVFESQFGHGTGWIEVGEDPEWRAFLAGADVEREELSVFHSPVHLSIKIVPEVSVPSCLNIAPVESNDHPRDIRISPRLGENLVAGALVWAQLHSPYHRWIGLAPLTSLFAGTQRGRRDLLVTWPVRPESEDSRDRKSHWSGEFIQVRAVERVIQVVVGDTTRIGRRRRGRVFDPNDGIGL